MPAPGFAKIIHPGNGNIAEVPVSSLGQHYAAGWAPLDETSEPEPDPDAAPAPVRASAVQAGSAEESGANDNDGNSSKEGEN